MGAAGTSSLRVPPFGLDPRGKILAIARLSLEHQHRQGSESAVGDRLCQMLPIELVKTAVPTHPGPSGVAGCLLKQPGQSPSPIPAGSRNGRGLRRKFHLGMRGTEL